MKLQHMFKKPGDILPRGKKRESLGKTPEVPEGLLKKCNACKAAIITEDVIRNAYICPKCGNYFRIHARRRLSMLADPGSFEEWNAGLPIKNPMGYRGYEEKLEKTREKTGLDEAVLTGKIRIEGQEAAIGIFDSRFIMASMGSVVGEKLTRTIERATKEKLPLIIFACSGGARMQEGIASLMQMAKTAAALKRHSDAGLLYISVLTNPTTGGVTASFAMLGDIILAEPGALIGFAGPRVIEQTIGQKLPEGFQKSEFLLEHGFIDRIVERSELKAVLLGILRLHEERALPFSSEDKAAATVDSLHKELSDCSAWERVEISRQKDRPVGSDYLERLFSDFIELHGDRYFGDDKAILGGIASFLGVPVTVIAQEKGKTTGENIACNFGMPSPEGYRKALRLMKQAEKFHRPIICFVDTPGAFCGIEAEERGQGEAIARNLFEMVGLKVPVLSIVIGEGGSGGALAMAVADEVWMLENSVYSILSPEGFATILWKDKNRAREAAEVMKLTAADLKEAGIIEHVIKEPEHLAIDTMDGVCASLSLWLREFLMLYEAMGAEERCEKRYGRFRNF